MRLLPILLLFAASACFAEPRPKISGVSSVRIANYNAPSTVFKERVQVSDVVDDLNRLRGKDWQRGEIKLSCYSTLVLLRGEKRIAEFRIGADGIAERPVEKGQSSYSLVIGADELPAIRKLQKEIAPVKDCQ